MSEPAFDLQARIARLFTYPVKSCAGIQVPRALLTETGLQWDRHWMVVDETGVFVSQRERPRMALVQPALLEPASGEGALELRTLGMTPLRLPLNQPGERRRVQVWSDTLDAIDEGDEAARWFSQALSTPDAPAGLRLVRFDPNQRRLASRKWTGDIEAPTQFADGFALLVLGEGSIADLNVQLTGSGHAPVGMERFRPNILLGDIEAQDEDRVDMLLVGNSAVGEPNAIELLPAKPCVRCSIPDIDPATAQSSPEVSGTLRSYRADLRVDGGITFGMNCIVRRGVGQSIETGQAVRANYQFD